MAVKKRVKRFSGAARFTHWAVAISFILLFFTGLGLFSPRFNGLIAVFGGFETSMVIHRLAAKVFIIAPIIGFIMAPRAALGFLKEIFSWDKDDWIYIRKFPKEYFGLKPELPPQGRFNAGEKLNSIIIFLGGLLLVASGLVMWVGGPEGLILVAYPIHSLTFVITSTFVIGHLFMAVYHPSNRDALDGMMSGWVTEDFAKGHHSKWYQKIVGK